MSARTRALLRLASWFGAVFLALAVVGAAIEAAGLNRVAGYAILNAILLLVTAALLENLAIDGLSRAIAGALVIAIVTTVLELVLRPVASATATDPTLVDPV